MCCFKGDQMSPHSTDVCALLLLNYERSCVELKVLYIQQLETSISHSRVKFSQYPKVKKNF
ncbi:hypothetical protein EXN66_Car018730 [Channa argus]|uniref:Uncharacterized protein n=1 Tax=Channa argus TaxID=215402 RepID=A0A6G1QKG5_CHAAH|nr:hypothetical protein EXN66_Car018730 [Channa argus]